MPRPKQECVLFMDLTAGCGGGGGVGGLSASEPQPSSQLSCYGRLFLLMMCGLIPIGEVLITVHFLSDPHIV